MQQNPPLALTRINPAANVPRRSAAACSPKGQWFPRKQMLPFDNRRPAYSNRPHYRQRDHTPFETTREPSPPFLIRRIATASEKAAEDRRGSSTRKSEAFGVQPTACDAEPGNFFHGVISDVNLPDDIAVDTNKSVSTTKKSGARHRSGSSSRHSRTGSSDTPRRPRSRSKRDSRKVKKSKKHKSSRHRKHKKRRSHSDSANSTTDHEGEKNRLSFSKKKSKHKGHKRHHRTASPSSDSSYSIPIESSSKKRQMYSESRQIENRPCKKRKLPSPPVVNTVGKKSGDEEYSPWDNATSSNAKCDPVANPDYNHTSSVSNQSMSSTMHLDPELSGLCGRGGLLHGYLGSEDTTSSSSDLGQDPALLSLADLLVSLQQQTSNASE